MAVLNSIRDFHTQLAGVCASLETIIRLAGQDFEDIEIAMAPSMEKFRELLYLGDKIAGPDLEQ